MPDTSDIATARPGRPRRSSAEILADAAAELFLEQGYAATSVDEIARRAGVSRGTFFNYFGGKSDLFWVDLDATLAGLAGVLRASSGSGSSARSGAIAVAGALVELAESYDPARVPWALTQADAMRLGDEVVTSGALRFAAQNRVVTQLLAEDGVAAPQLVSSTLLIAAAGAFVGWARGGVGRGALGPLVAAAVAPVVQGLSG